MTKVVAALFAAVLLFAGCGGEDTGKVSSSPDPSPDQPSAAEPADDVVVDIAIRNGKVRPQGDRVEVKVGQKVTLRISSDAADEIHVHSDPERTYPVKPGDSREESFTIGRPGQVAVEAHESGATVVQLVVRP